MKQIMKKVVSISEMIEVIKEKTGWSEAILAIELGVGSQNITSWKRGTIPRSKNYKRLKELYEDLIKDDSEVVNKNNKIELGLLDRLAEADKHLEDLARKQDLYQQNLAWVNGKITVWTHEKRKLTKKLEELRGKKYE